MDANHILATIVNKIRTQDLAGVIHSKTDTKEPAICTIMPEESAIGITSCVLEGSINIVFKVTNLSYLLTVMKDTFKLIESSKEDFNAWYSINKEEIFSESVQDFMEKENFDSNDIYGSTELLIPVLEKLVNDQIIVLTNALTYINNAYNTENTNPSLKKDISLYLSILNSSDMSKEEILKTLPRKNTIFNSYILAEVFKKCKPVENLDNVLKAHPYDITFLCVILYFEMKKYLEDTNDFVAYKYKKDGYAEYSNIFSAIEEFMDSEITEEQQFEVILDFFN